MRDTADFGITDFLTTTAKLLKILDKNEFKILTKQSCLLLIFFDFNHTNFYCIMNATISQIPKSGPFLVNQAKISVSFT